MPVSVSLVVGTRPEIIKLAPVVHECHERGVDVSLVHTGQHYTEDLDKVFFEQLELPVPDHNLEVGSGSHGRQTGEMISGIEGILQAEQPDVLLVQGDTNSVLAGGIAASKLPDVDLGHVEAGLRSYDRQMPEEVNRRLVDHASDHLFAPTDPARENLRAENIPNERITVTGNTIVDAVHHNVAIAHEESDVVATLGVEGPFALLTAHREENVDDPERFESLLAGVAGSARDHDLEVIYPIHPRADKRLGEFGIDVPPEITVIDPLDFLDFLVLEDEATIVFTDSGGVQEESCILGTPCVTLRDSTERPETVDVGANRVVGLRGENIREGASVALATDRDWENPFGDGRAAERILDVIEHDDD
jgi:UDP-N-acetylglucosamine 2-epimerase (non-hydrolysing)